MNHVSAFVCRVAAVSSLFLAAYSSHAAEPLALRAVMKDMSTNMQVITDAIAREDWELVRDTVPQIADHAQPPAAEKARIMQFMGAEMAKFKAYDGEVHQAAQGLAAAAGNQDAPGVIAAFQKVQTACHNCHRDYRKRIVDHFYGER